MDSIGAGSYRAQALRDQMIYEDRLNALSAERDARAEEALAAQQRFATTLDQVSVHAEPNSSRPRPAPTSCAPAST